MSSTLQNYQHILRAATEMEMALRVATPFTAMHTRGGTMVDMGADVATHEMMKGNRKASPLVARRLGGFKNTDKNVIRPGEIGANDYLFAYIPQDLELPANVLNKRVPGESMFVRGTEDDIKMMRRAYWMRKMYMDAMRRVIVRNELLARQSYFDAEMDLGENWQGQKKLVFPRSAALKNRTVTTSWATHASATPWTDIGNAQRQIKSLSNIDGSGMWFATMSGSAMSNLRAIYRAQRAGDEGPNVEFNYFKFDPDQGVPMELQYLIDNGMEYNGWMRTDYSNSRVHLFTLPEGYDSTEGDSAETYTDWITGETISVGLTGMGFHSAYYGPGILEPPENNIVEAAIGRVGVPNIADPSSLTLGNSGIPVTSMMLNIYSLGRNQGFGATLEHGPMYAPKWADITATIDTLTT